MTINFGQFSPPGFPLHPLPSPQELNQRLFALRSELNQTGEVPDLLSQFDKTYTHLQRLDPQSESFKMYHKDLATLFEIIIKSRVPPQQ